MASVLISSIQSLSTKLLEAIRGSTSHQKEPASPAAVDQNEGVRKDLEKLSRMLARIQAVQQDAEEREIHDRSVRLWLEELRGVAYQAEDVLDEFHYEVLRSIVEGGDAAIESYHRDRGTKRKFAEMFASSSLASSSSTVTNPSIPDGLGAKIKSIKERFEEISNARRDLHLREEDGTRLVPGPQTRPPTSSYVDERGIFGREKEKEKIINLLDPSNGPNFMVLPIVGMGGLGKTTLAQLVYNDSMFCQLFEKKAWVSVSEKFDLVHLTKAIIESMSDDPCHFSELNKLQDVLNKKIRGVRVFLVLDDIWNEKRNLWEHFRDAIHGAETIRILATTRNKLVAEIMQTTPYFQLDCLPEERCWLLFKHFAFDNREASENPSLLEIGRGIVKKCNGLPLANKVLGGMLCYETDEKKWRDVLESDIPEIDETGEIMPALWLSYRKLPLHLRPCLLFLSMFPKGKRFEKDKVVRLWMAQGYVNCTARSKKTLEETGSEYFDELQGRSVVEQQDHMYFLHDLIHDLARSISQGINQPILEDGKLDINSCEVHHLYLTKKDESSGFLEPSNYRTIRTVVEERASSYVIDSAVFCNFACVRAFELSVCPNTFGTFKHLRYLSIGGDWIKKLPESLCLLYNLQSLHMDCCNIEELPEDIKKLVNLRYLGLFRCKIVQLPESICLLGNLDTLILEGCWRLNKLPRNIEQLTNLRILNLNHCPNIGQPSGSGKLPKLKTLIGCFDVKEDDMIRGLEELENMNKLSGLLCISGLKNIGNMEYSRKANLASKPNLSQLILNFEKGDLVPKNRNQGLFMVVSASSTRKNETNGKLQEGVLESLRPHENLKELKILHYGGIQFPSWLLHPSLMPLQQASLSFLSLKVITLIGMSNLVEWEVCDGHFPCLKELRMYNCPKLWRATIPRQVETLEINGCGCQVIKFYSQSKLLNIMIIDCKELISIYYKNGDLPVLKSVTLFGCPNLLIFSAIKEEMKQSDMIDCGFEEIKSSSKSKIQNTLIFDDRVLIPVNNANGYNPSRGRVSLSDCPKLRVFSAIPIALNELEIHNCGCGEIMLPSICQQLQISDCLELISITFIDCPKLELPRVLKQVRKLQIKSCSIHKIIFESQSQIQILEIKHCPELFIVHWNDGDVPFLREISIEGCPKLLSISVIPNEIHQLVITKCGLREIQFPIQCQISCVHISFCQELISLHFSEEDLPLLKKLSIRSCPQLHEVLTIPNGLKQLEIINCNYPEIRLLSQSKLQQLSITECAKLTTIQGLQVQFSLIRLHISFCPILQFPIDSVSHPMMEEIEIHNCPKMDFGSQRKGYFYRRVWRNASGTSHQLALFLKRTVEKLSSRTHDRDRCM